MSRDVRSFRVDLKGLPQILAEELKVFHRRADSNDLSQEAQESISVKVWLLKSRVVSFLVRFTSSFIFSCCLQGFAACW